MKFVIGFIIGVVAHYCWCKYGDTCDCKDKVKWNKKK